MCARIHIHLPHIKREREKKETQNHTKHGVKRELSSHARNEKGKCRCVRGERSVRWIQKYVKGVMIQKALGKGEKAFFQQRLCVCVYVCVLCDDWKKWMMEGEN